MIADCDDKGILKEGYCLVQRKVVRRTDSTAAFAVLLCSCPASKQQNFRICSLPTILKEEEFEMIIKMEASEYCIHSQSIENLFDVLDHSSDSDDTDNDEPVVDIISFTPLLISVFDGNAYGLVGHKRSKKLYCLTCEYDCHHVTQTQEWCSSNNVHLDLIENFSEESSYTSISYKPIPYPLPRHLRRLHDKHEMGKCEFPLQLIPSESDSSTCAHGNSFNMDDPVSRNWISRKGVTIYKEAVTIDDLERTAYYRPTTGKCKCRLEYDGQGDLIFNLDGKHMFYYGFLLLYLHLMLEGRNPLIAFYRSSCKSFYIQSESKPVHVNLLRQAWNAFARLLDINWNESFNCHLCGLAPQTIICDGTLIGFRKDLASAAFSETVPEEGAIIKGSEHTDRVLLKSLKSRELLLKYSGYSKQRRCLSSNSGLNLAEFSQFKKLCKKEQCNELAELLDYLSADKNPKISPSEYMEFFNELSRCSPVCGTFQVAGNSQALEAIKKVCAGLNLRHPSQMSDLKAIQEHAPVLANVLLNCSYPLPKQFLDFMQLLISYISAPFGKRDAHFSEPDIGSRLSFFPNHPLVRGVGKYASDLKLLSQEKDSCRKYATHHPTLTPGIFTLYCPHGICYGFEVMRNHESPRTPFQIFFTRFLQPPKVIIYDNACKLHQYILNREPDHFKSTKFLIDRFHWKGHVGCSSGYNLKNYSTFDMTAINSQVNEQANAGLQRIKSHVSYMKEDNFVFHIKLFLALTNNRKQQI